MTHRLCSPVKVSATTTGYRGQSQRDSVASDECERQDEAPPSLMNAHRDYTTALCALRAAVRIGVEIGINDKVPNENRAETMHPYRATNG